MQKKPFMFAILVILLAQPFVVVSSIPFAHDTIAQINTTESFTQTAGSRLNPEDYTQHVPVVIDEDADFVTQGWPGSGTDVDPYIIAGLNITYDLGTSLISVINTDLHFIIRDCVINNAASVPRAVMLVNVTHGTLEFLTITSVDEAIICFNANNTLIDNVAVESGDLWGVTLLNSTDISLNQNNFTSLSKYSTVIAYCENFVSTSNIFQTNALETNLDVEYCEDSTFDHDTIVGGWISLEMVECENINITDMTFLESSYGLYIVDSEFINVESCDFSDGEYDAGTVLNSRNIRIVDSMFSSANGWGLELVDTNNTDVIGNFINDTGIHGLGLVDCLHILLRDNYVGFAGDEGFELIDSVDVTVYSNTITETGEWGLALLGVDWGNVTENSITTTALQAVYSDSCDNGEFYNNFVNDTSNYGVHFNAAENWTLYDNEISFVHTGIAASSMTNTEIYRNTINHASSTGIDVATSPDSEIVNNTVSNSGYGIKIASSDRSNIEDNNIQMNLENLVLLDSLNLTVMSNTLTDALEVGLYCHGSSRALFQNNIMTRCGFRFGSIVSIDHLNHTFVSNTVNGKPLYYNLSQNGLTINGTLYGEVILANCSDSSISGGDFHDSTDGIHLYWSHRNNISGVYMTGQNRAVYFWESDNNTLRDSTIEFCEGSDTIWIEFSEGSVIHNVNMTHISSPAIYVDYSANTTIQFCNFQDIQDLAIEVGTSDYLLIQNSTFLNIEGRGIDLFDAYYATVQHCELQNIAEDGIAIETSAWNPTYALIYANYFINVSAGIQSYTYSDSMNITHNDFMWCEYGIRTNWADFSHISFNYFHDNDYGVYLFNSYTVEVYNNTFYWNNIGVELESCSGNMIFYNIFGPNFGYSGYADASYLWDDNVDTGNYWYDFDGTAPYQIPGGSSIDRYPMVYDPPTEPIINTPMDIRYAEGSEGNIIGWIPFDDNLREWTVTIDDVVWDADAWNFENITVNVDGLAYGEYIVFIVVEDLDGNTVNDTVFIEVFDDTPPEIDGPPDTWLFGDTTDQTITWEVSDLNPNNYTVYLDGVEFETGTWTTGELVIDFEGVTEGLYEVIVLIHDVDGLPASDTLMFLMINDDDSPTVDHPDDVDYLEGATGNVIIWTPSDEFPDRYEVSFNGTAYESDDWGGSRVTINVDGLSEGWVEFTITVYDMSGNSATDTVNVTVIPLIQEPPVPMVDYVLLIIIGAVIGVIVVVVALVYYLKKKKGATG